MIYSPSESMTRPEEVTELENGTEQGQYSNIKNVFTYTETTPTGEKEKGSIMQHMRTLRPLPLARRRKAVSCITYVH